MLLCLVVYVTILQCVPPDVETIHKFGSTIVAIVQLEVNGKDQQIVVEVPFYKHIGPLLLTWINFEPSVDKYSHTQ